MDDRLLIDRLRQGDARAFNDLYERFRPRLYTFLLRMAGQQAVAQDLLQDTWMSAAIHARRLAIDSNLEAWLFTIARNALRSYRRRTVWVGARLRELARQSLVPMPGPRSPLDELAASELQVQLAGALARLPWKYREVLLLVGVEQMPAAQAGQVLGLRTEAVRQRLSRARTMMEAQLRMFESAGVAPGVTT